MTWITFILNQNEQEHIDRISLCYAFRFYYYYYYENIVNLNFTKQNQIFPDFIIKLTTDLNNLQLTSNQFISPNYFYCILSYLKISPSIQH